MWVLALQARVVELGEEHEARPIIALMPMSAEASWMRRRGKDVISWLYRWLLQAL
jgi:hypothetical protein